MVKIQENLSVERELARRNTDKHPSLKQCKAGNYKKGKLKFNGILITIENPKGSYRRGKDKDGHEWKTLMHNDYGYFNRTVGKDGDAIDVFLGPNLNSKKIFPIDQFLNGQFDETKVMIGFNSAEEAKAAYLSNYEKDWKGFKYITEVGMDIFKKWLYDGYRQRKPFAKYVRLTENKETQLGIINDTNPMLDDYHTGIRKVEDIKTFEEAMAEAKSDFEEYGYYSSYPDTPNSVLEKALETGMITVYSSKPIENGNFVTTSKMCAKDYAGGGEVYSETLPTEDIAWINVEEGQVAKVNKLNESPDNCGEHNYMDSDAFSFLKVGGKYYISTPGQSHEELFNELIIDGKVTKKEAKDKGAIWDTSGRFWNDGNILSFWYLPEEDEMGAVVDFLCSQKGIKINPATLLIDVWDMPIIEEGKSLLIPYKWFKNGTFETLHNIIRDIYQFDKNTFYVKTTKGSYYIDWAGNIMSTAEFYSKYSQVSESKKQRKNDKGEVVPEKCECGGKICVQIHGEPVFICKDCGKYYGTLPFVNEHIDIKKALKNLKKRRDPANIENWNNMINEDFSSSRLAQLAKEHGGIKISRNGGLRDFPCAFINGYSVNPSEITDDMIIDDGDYNNCIEFNDGTIVGLRKDSEVSRRTAGERKANRLGSGVGDTGDHDKSRGGFIGSGKDSVSTPYNGYAVSDKAGEAQALRNSLEFNKAANDKRGEEDIRRRARNLANVAESEEKDINKEIGKAIRRGNREADIEAHGKSVAFRPTITKNPKAYTRKVKHKEPLAEGRRVYLTEEQFKAYCRQILREKRNEDYLKEIIKESLNK